MIVRRQILFFDLLDDILHFDGVVHHGVSLCFFFLHNLVKGVLMQQLKVLTSIVRDFFLKDVFELFLLSWLGHFLPSEVLFISLILSNFIPPIIHPLHSIQMRTGNQPCLHLYPL